MSAASIQSVVVAWALLAEGGQPSAWWLLGLIPLAAAAAFSAVALYRWYWDPRRLEQAARRARERGNLVQAIAGYQRLLRRLTAREGQVRKQREAAEYVQVFRRARIALGELYQERGEHAAAVQQFMSARKLGAKLPPEALALVAGHYAARGDRGPDAVEAYLRYAAARPPAGPADPVYRILQAACVIEETSEAAARRTALALNRRVIKARAELEWAHYYLGLGHLMGGELPSATEAFEQARQLNPGRALTYYWLGACRLQQTPPDLEGAAQALAKFLSASTTNQKFLRRQERAALELGRKLVARAGGFDLGGQALAEAQQADLERAVGYFEYALGKNPASQEGCFYLGRARSVQGEREKAIAALAAAARLASEREPRKPALALPRCLYYLGAEQWRAGSLEEAASAFERATELEPNFAEAHALAAELGLRQGDYSRAESHARASLRLRGPAAGALACLLQALYHQSRFQAVVAELEEAVEPAFAEAERAALGLAVGRSYLWVGQFEKAVQWLGSAAASPQADYYLGCALAHSGRLEEALERFARVEAGGGELALRAQLQRGHLHLRRSEWEAAEAAYLAVEAAQPPSAETLYALGCLYSGQGELDKAAGYLARMVEAEPGSARGQLALGLVAERRGQAEEAVRHYGAALAGGAGAEVAKARERLGVLHCRRGEHERGAEQLEEARRLGASGDAVLFYLGLARLRGERSTEAVELWSRLAERHSEDEQLAGNLASARYLAGAHYAARGQYEESIAQFEGYLEKAPGDAQAVSNLARLYFALALRELSRGPGADLARSEGLLKKALERDPEARESRYYWALCALGLGRYADCRARLEPLAQIESEPRVLYHLGLCRYRQGDRAGALEVFHRLAQQAEGAGDHAQRAACLVANEYAAAGRYGEAATLLEEGLGLIPGRMLT